MTDAIEERLAQLGYVLPKPVQLPTGVTLPDVSGA